jgi:transposase-like protein
VKREAVSKNRKVKRALIETLLNEEALLLTSYLRDERKTWIPRITLCSRSQLIE